jgi:hypothetical protein
MAAYAPSINNQISSDASSSAVSWAAVISGAFVAAALSLILIALGAGLGLSSVSPWSNAGASASSVGKIGIGWLIVTQVLASAMGGYLAGRLRTKWVSIHTDEVYFRDTAHGFLVWAVGVVITASLLTSAALSMAGSSLASTAENHSPNGVAGGNGYFADALLRSDRVSSERAAETKAEIETILAHGLTQKEISAADRTYLATLVTARTGLTQAEAQDRVHSVIADALKAADDTRKAAAHLLLWTFLALLLGAFFASYAATIGGKQRDQVKMPAQ